MHLLRHLIVHGCAINDSLPDAVISPEHGLCPQGHKHQIPQPHLCMHAQTRTSTKTRPSTYSVFVHRYIHDVYVFIYRHMHTSIHTCIVPIAPVRENLHACLCTAPLASASKPPCPTTNAFLYKTWCNGPQIVAANMWEVLLFFLHWPSPSLLGI